VEISTNFKLSCLSWNKCVDPLIASSVHEGIITIWNVNTGLGVMEYKEHERHAWSVNFFPNRAIHAGFWKR
jgi:WD40 repeat protein